MPRQVLYVGLDPRHYQKERKLNQGELTHFPLIKIIPRPLTDPVVYRSLQIFSSYTHVILTSKSSVSILVNYLKMMGFTLKDWQSKVTCVVGKTTALSLKEAGILAKIVAKDETAEGLIQALYSLQFKKDYLFWPHSSSARPLIKNFLKEFFTFHQSCELYDTQTISYSCLPLLKDFDEVILTSPSTVKAFLHHFHYFPPHLKITAIGPVTANYLRSLSTRETSQVFLPIN